MSAHPVPTPSPLKVLSRPKSRRTSPFGQSRRESANGARYSPDRSVGISMDDSDDEGGNAPQLSHLAQMLLEQFPEANGDRAEAAPRAEPAPKRLSWAENEYRIYPAREPRSGEGSPHYATAHEMVTPAPGRHPRRLFNGTYSAVGSSGSGSSANSSESKEDGPTGAATNHGSIVRPGPAGVHASTTASAVRWKRSGRGLLGSLAGPPRRGPRRDSDQTEEGNDPYDKSSPEDQPHRPASTPPKSSPREAIEQPMATISRRPRRASPEALSEQEPRLTVYTSSSPEGLASEDPDKPMNPSSASSRAAAIAAAAAAPPIAQPRPDKENMPPPPGTRKSAVAASTYRRMMLPEEKKSLEHLPQSPSRNAEEAGERKPALAAKSNNTPLRPAPPPPRMSMLEAATASAGASVTNTNQTTRRSKNTVQLNGNLYQRLDVIGKGGSSRVYKVMAENKKMFALKKVSFTEQDGPSAIAGYKGEIDLLRKLSGVERVIRLFDYEINDKKQTLSMLMECGESDLAKILTHRHANEDSQLDISFVRYYWREMLLCVDAVHSLNIIHSDLKPANFLLVQGRLKLIDFGIANAIEDDTVNVYRESQVGTLNYMSPEAIIDINAASGKPMASMGQSRLMKLGAPSDVWSLGCILYQMTYGRTPFSHITGMYQKISVIPDPTYSIEYPPTGIGGAVVPRSLITVIRGCLQREKDDRPTIKRMLSNDDVFLNPDRAREGHVEISLGNLKHLLENAVQQVETQGAPSPETIASWAQDVYHKLEKRMEVR